MEIMVLQFIYSVPDAGNSGGALLKYLLL